MFDVTDACGRCRRKMASAEERSEFYTKETKISHRISLITENLNTMRFLENLGERRVCVVEGALDPFDCKIYRF